MGGNGRVNAFYKAAYQDAHPHIFFDIPDDVASELMKEPVHVEQFAEWRKVNAQSVSARNRLLELFKEVHGMITCAVY